MLDKEIAVSADHTFQFELYRNGMQIVPASATVTIYDNGGASKQTGAATIDTSGDVTYTYLTANNGTIESNFKIKLVYVYGGVSYTQYHLFDVVKTPLACLVTDDDLFAYLPDLRDRVKERTTEVTATGTTTAITCADLKADTRDFTGGYLQLFIAPTDDCGVTDTHEARVTVYDKTTGAITFTPAYSTNVASGTAVSIRPSYSTLIHRVWLDQVLRDVRNAVGPAAGYIDSNTVKLATICKAIAVHCFALSEEAEDKWARRAIGFEAEYKAELARIQQGYDKDEDGNIDQSEKDNPPSFGFVQIIR